MTRLDEFLWGGVRVRISGAAPEKFLNSLSEAGIECYDTEPLDEFTLLAGLRRRDLGRARSCAARSQCDIRVVRERGAPALGRRLRRRMALLAAGVICFALLAASSLFVWDIEVTGCESVSEGEVLRALAEAGARPGSFWPGWDAGAIANHVLLAVPELAWAGVSVSGSRAEVKVRERTAPPELMDVPGSVAARATGIIESMEVFSGAPLVSVGDAVAEGETLVSGSVTGASGNTRQVHASARVIARSFTELTVSAPLEAREAADAPARTRWAVAVGGRRFNFFPGSSQTPPGCGKIITEYPLAVEGVFTLPVTLLRETVAAYGPGAAGEGRAATEERLVDFLARTLERRLGDRGEVLSAEYTARESGGRLYVTVRAECREDIAGFVPAE